MSQPEQRANRDPIDPAPSSDCAACGKVISKGGNHNVTTTYDIVCDSCAGRLDRREVRWRTSRAEAARLARRWP